MKSKMFRWMQNKARMRVVECTEMLSEILLLKILFRRPKHGWKYNIKIDHKETELMKVIWIFQVEDRDDWLALVNAVMNRVRTGQGISFKAE
jgi:hypothetical protein